MVYILIIGYETGAAMAKADDQTEWTIRAKNILKAELKRKGVSYRELSERLAQKGVTLSEQGVNNKISRGGFTAGFFVLCLDAIGVETISVR